MGTAGSADRLFHVEHRRDMPPPLAVTASPAAATGERQEATAARSTEGEGGTAAVGVFLCARGGVMHDAKLQGCWRRRVAADIPRAALTANLTAG